MRLFLLIALVLLPLSIALMCYEGTDNVEDYAGSVPKAECKSDTKSYGSSTILRDVCTCKSDNCNESKAKAEESINSTPPSQPSAPPLKCYNGTVVMVGG
ncbi:hypothetical protein PRIPAC_89363 [Pristionchus pacificus]|uniref:Uncharacterized protein n=1 Tax=Pristionchus pacificus TaxID=54126 RepID=A0A2A6B907_PRIPA|nr:hypothetical protein PRIPAC_89363 [Pristionchus pacificus]|eukprot:PDM62370.1 hypothetical protein PRIPAC_51812 [Pristionchus pacificus]